MGGDDFGLVEGEGFAVAGAGEVGEVGIASGFGGLGAKGAAVFIDRLAQLRLVLERGQADFLPRALRRLAALAIAAANSLASGWVKSVMAWTPMRGGRRENVRHRLKRLLVPQTC